MADAYARWFPIARSKLREAERLVNACNHASWHQRDPTKLLEERRKLFQIGPLFEEVAIASREVLLFEQDTSLRERVQALTKIPLMIPNDIGGRHHQAVVALNSAVMQRRQEIERLVADVATRLGGTTVTAVDLAQTDGSALPPAEDSE